MWLSEPSQPRHKFYVLVLVMGPFQTPDKILLFSSIYFKVQASTDKGFTLPVCLPLQHKLNTGFYKSTAKYRHHIFGKNACREDSLTSWGLVIISQSSRH